jgi:hypothetical protein
MNLRDRIIAYVIKKNSLVSSEKLVSVASGAGFSEGEVLQVLSSIGNKLKSTVRGNQVYYQIPPAPKTPVDHLAWVRNHYPPMDSTNDGSGIDIDYSFLFLKTKEERDNFKALASGRPTYMIKSRYEKRV